MSIKDEDRFLTQDELEDAWHTLQFSEKVNDQRSLNICLDLINSQVNNWLQAKLVIEVDTLQRIMTKSDYTTLTSNKILAQEIHEKVKNIESVKGNEFGETFQRQVNDSQYEDTMSLASENLNGDNYAANQYEKPTSTRMCLFQLTESNDINRVTMILETLGMKSKETLNQLRRKYNLSTKLFNVLKKYCNAEYGFDQLSSRHGSFQYNLLKLFIVMSQDYVVFLECLQTQTLDYLSQIIEEGIIFGYEDAISGASSIIHASLTIKQLASNNGFNSDLFKFLKLSLDFIELAISKQFQEFLPSIRENLRKIQERMVKLIQKKENALLTYFIQNYTSQASQASLQTITNSKQQQAILTEQDKIQSLTISSPNQLSVDQLSELQSLSESLYQFALELNNKVQKIEALVDLQEDHDEKFTRLFYKIIGQKIVTKQIDRDDIIAKVALKDKDKLKSQGGGRVQFDLQRNYDQDFNEERFKQNLKSYDSNSNYDSSYTLQKDNVFMRNQLESIGFKRKINEQNCYKEGMNAEKNKENEPHFIGSPIKSYKRITADNNKGIIPTHQGRTHFKH